MTEKVIPFRGRDRQEQSDEALLTASAAGDNAAVEELFRRHGDRVHRILVRLRCCDRRDLEDLVQTTFIEVPRSAARFDGRSSVGTWIVGIAMNVVRHHARSESRRRLAMAVVASEPPASQGPRPDEWAAQRELVGRLQAVFESLPTDLRIAFTLVDIEGMRGVDVARALRVPEGTVWRRLHEARLRLRRGLGGDDEEGQG